MTPWEIKATELANCNCSYGCPCQLNALPTYGNCEAVVCNEVTEGRYGDVGLNGVRYGAVFWWPGPVHEGKGKGQPFVDASASEAQRDAILKIMSGQDTGPDGNRLLRLLLYAGRVFDPIFAPIEFEVDVEARKGRFVVPGVAECTGEPIKNPVTGAEHRARINLPHRPGFEYEIAEIGSATATTRGNIKLDLKDSYAQFAHLHLNNHGVVRHRSVA